jgi:hypothetical protein
MSSISQPVSSSSSSKISSQIRVSTEKATSSTQITNPSTPSISSKASFFSNSLNKLISSSSSAKPSSSRFQTTISSAVSTSAPPIIQDFNTALDDAVGYLNSSAPGFWSQLLPGVPASDIPGFGPFRRRLRTRTWDVTKILNALQLAVSVVMS